MPTYTFLNKKTQKEHSMLLWISELDAYLAENPDLDLVPSAPPIVAGREGGHKVDSGFKDLLKEMKKCYGSRGGNFGKYAE